MGSIFPPLHPLFLALSLCPSLSLPSISAASFLHPSLPYTSPIIALEQCQPPVGPQTAGLSSPSVLLLSPWPHLLNTLLVSGSVESHCGLTKEMWDWFLPLQIELKFSSCVCVCVCAQRHVCVCVSTKDSERKRKKVGKIFQKKEREREGGFGFSFSSTSSEEHTVRMCTCMSRVFAHYYSLVRTRVFEMRVC